LDLKELKPDFILTKKAKPRNLKIKIEQFGFLFPFFKNST